MGKKLLGLGLIAGAFLLVPMAYKGEIAGVYVSFWFSSIEHFLGENSVEEMEGQKITFKAHRNIETSFGTGSYVIENDVIVFSLEQGDEVSNKKEKDKMAVHSFINRIFCDKEGLKVSGKKLSLQLGA